MREGCGSQEEDLGFDETRKELTQRTLGWVGSALQWPGKKGSQGRDHLEAAGVIQPSHDDSEIEMG